MNDDDSICDDIEEDNETVDDDCNEGENWFVSERVSELIKERHNLYFIYFIIF